METKTVLINLRKKHGLTQEEMAEKFFVTRQAVSEWETGKATPNNEILKSISKEFNISINTLLGSPQQLICQCCGMPLEDEFISREIDSSFNEDYCKWCYNDGEMVYKSLDKLMEFLVPHMAGMFQKNETDMKIILESQLPNLKYWREKAV